MSGRPDLEPGSRLDELARQVADGTFSRRRAAAGIGATFAAILFAPVGVAFGRKDCPNGRVKCDGACCPKGARCRRGKCRCPKGERKCGTKCVDTATNRKNCGACRNVCVDGEGCFDGSCRPPDQQAVCGNGAIEGAEQCDGAALGGQTCVGLGFTGGTLACGSSCTFDTSGCTGQSQAVCGNGVIEAGEQCDGAALGGATCVSLGHPGGALACNSNCTYNTSGCSVCGNGVVESGAGEVCDGTNLGGRSCTDFGFQDGALACAPGCASFDTGGCFLCGNGVKEGPEQCDGSDLGGATCATLLACPGATGTVTCTPACNYNISSCECCGNEILEGSEQCDGANLGGQTCVGLGFAGGTLACGSNCTFDTSACI